MSSKDKSKVSGSEAQTITKADVGSLEDVLGSAAEVKPDVAQEVEVATKTSPVEVPYLPMISLQMDLPAQINALVGNPAAGGWEAIDKQFKIMTGEWNELSKSIADRDYATIADDIPDLLFTLIGFTYAAGMLDVLGGNWYRVCTSQFSKFDRNEHDALLTRAKYEKKGMVVHTEVVKQNDSLYYITKSSIEQVDPGRNETIPAGKWLKSYNFNDPVLELPPTEVQAKFAVPAKA
jgi:hypothetical protein